MHIHLYVYTYKHYIHIFFSGCLPTSYGLDLKTFNFFNGIKVQSNSLQLILFTWFGQDELFKLSNKYSLMPGDSIFVLKRKLFNKMELEML